MAYDQFVVEIWEVGQGDCSVIHLPSGELILIDVGPIGSPIVNWLSRQPTRRIHSIVLTHNDSDHVGALTSLIPSCFGRIGIVYVMADRYVKDARFRDLYRVADEAQKTGGIKKIQRLEAPLTLWSDMKTGLTLDVRYPNMSANVMSNTPNETSAVIVLTSKKKETILWAGDTTIANVSTVASENAPICMLGPHHGAPEDRQHKEFSVNLSTIGPKIVVASVGSNNPYGHPSVSYIKHVRRIGGRFYCTQLTKNCEKPFHFHHVCKGAALLGLPQVTTGFSCRGTIQLTFDGQYFIPDKLAEQKHAEGIKTLTRPKCSKYGPNQPQRTLR